ncbi:MAG: hypothetical protein ACTSQF_08155 [Candidatus Heimdallarchaeaceae archaeon]
MAITKEKRTAKSIWISIKPFLIPLLVIAVLMSLALLIVALVWLYDEKDVTFIVLVIANISVLGIFALGFFIVGVKYVIVFLRKKEEVRCIQCDKIMLGKGLYCSSCRKENKGI